MLSGLLHVYNTYKYFGDKCSHLKLQNAHLSVLYTPSQREHAEKYGTSYNRWVSAERRKTQRGKGVERLYCKRPIQCLASSKILTPHPRTARRVCSVSPAFGAGGGHTRWVERGWGVNILEEASHCSVLYIRMYFVGKGFPPPDILLEMVISLQVGGISAVYCTYMNSSPRKLCI